MELQSTAPSLIASIEKPHPQPEERVILFTDMVSYSHWIEEDESTTLEFMTGCFDTLRVLAHRHSGRLVKTMGDGALLVFDVADDAVTCGIEYQRVMSKIQKDFSDPYSFRVGMHLGEVVLRNGDVFGNTVNIASRLQSLADPGGCVVTEQVFRATGELPTLEFEDIGAPKLKNIQEKVQLFRVVDPLTSAKRVGSPAGPRLNLLDGVIFANQRRSPTSPTYRAALAILGYLSLCSGRADSIGRLAALIYPKCSEKPALKQVEEALEIIPGEMGLHKDVFFRNNEIIALDRLAIETDLETYLLDVRRGHVPDRFIEDADWPGQILAGFDSISPVFRSWLRVTKENWKRRVLHALERLIERTSMDDPAHEDAADAMLLLEPGNELAALARINARLAHNDRAAAFAEYERLKTYLSATCGVQPNNEIGARIKAAMSKDGDPTQNGHAPVRPRRILRIAVGQFQGPEGLNEHGALAFRAELIANLMRFRDWSIIDAAKAKSIAPEDTNIIDYVIDLDILGAPKVPTIILELRVHDTGRVVWTDNYSVSDDDWTAAMREIIREIVVVIELYVSADRLAATYDDTNRFSTIHDTWLRGDRALMRWTPEGAEEARVIFEDILEKDPDNAPALFRLSSISNISHIICPGLARNSDDSLKADKWASRAAELDPLDARIQRTVAWTAAMNGAFARASMHMDLAANLNPNCPTTLASCAMGFAWFGEGDKAGATLTQLQEISGNLPDWIWAYNASTLFFLGRFDEALEAAELGSGSIIDNQGWIAAIQANRGEMAAANAAFDKLCDNVKDAWAGESPMTRSAVADWFTHAFPIRRKADCVRLSDAIQAAMISA